MHESEKWKWSRSVLCDSSRPHGLQPTRLLRPWDFPGKSTGVGCHHLLRINTLLYCKCIFFFLHFFSIGMVLIPVSCTTSRTSVHGSSGTLSDLVPKIYFSLPLYNYKGFYLGHTWMSSGFPHFLQFKSEFGNTWFMIWATVSSQSCFCWLYRASPSLAAKNIINLISVLTIWWCPCVESALATTEKSCLFCWAKKTSAFWESGKFAHGLYIKYSFYWEQKSIFFISYHSTTNTHYVHLVKCMSCP